MVEMATPSWKKISCNFMKPHNTTEVEYHLLPSSLHGLNAGNLHALSLGETAATAATTFWIDSRPPTSPKMNS